MRDARILGRGELVRYLYRLGRQGGSGVLTVGVGPTTRNDVFVLRRGAIVVTDGELARRALMSRLVRMAALERVTAVFEGGVTAYPPGQLNQVHLATWARSHLEAQLDGAMADSLARDLAGVRVCLKKELAPEPADEADRRMLLAMERPRRLDQISPLARTPRFRMLAFLYFLRSVDALVLEGIATSGPVRTDSRRAAAFRLLGLGEDADVEAIKRAYRKLARALHPDLQPAVDVERRRSLERQFADVTAAYESLV